MLRFLGFVGFGLMISLGSLNVMQAASDANVGLAAINCLVACLGSVGFVLSMLRHLELF